MTDDVIHSTQLGQFAAQTIEAWQANSSTEKKNTPTAIKILFPWQLTLL